jgi:outer membrane protein assembly factor BamB
MNLKIWGFFLAFFIVLFVCFNIVFANETTVTLTTAASNTYDGGAPVTGLTGDTGCEYTIDTITAPLGTINTINCSAYVSAFNTKKTPAETIKCLECSDASCTAYNQIGATLTATSIGWKNFPNEAPSYCDTSEETCYFAVEVCELGHALDSVTLSDAYAGFDYEPPESDPPTFEYNNSNTTSINDGDPLLIYANWSDATGLGYAWLWTNETGTGKNWTGGTHGSPIDINLSVGETWSNFTWQNASVGCGNVVWKIYANETTVGNENVTGQMTVTVNPLKPTYSNNGTNSTEPKPNDAVLHYANWTAQSGTMDGYIFSNNYSGSWSNKTWASFGGGTWSNETNTSSGTGTYAWRVFANNSCGEWNDTGEQTITFVNKWLEVSLLTPTAGQTTNVVQNNTFDVNATVTCETNPSGYSCGSIDGSARYNSSGTEPNALISTTQGDTPFYIIGGIQEMLPTYAENSTQEVTAEVNESDDDYAIEYVVSAGGGAYESSNITINFTTAETYDNVNVESYWTTTGTSAPSEFRCWNGTNYISLGQNVEDTETNKTYSLASCDNSDGNYSFKTNCKFLAGIEDQNCYIYVDYVWLNKSGAVSNPYSFGVLNDGDTEQVNWTVNATGSLNSIYAIDVNFSSNVSQVSANNTSDAYIRISSPVDLKDQIVSPCANSSTDNDYCNPTTNPTVGTGVSPGSAFNITFRFVNSTSYNGTLNQTIHPKWEYSTYPTSNQVTSSSSYTAYTTDCTGQSGKPILYNVYNDSCGDIYCPVEIDGDVRLENSTSDQSSYDGNITFEIRFCSGTAGQTFDISPYVKVATDGALTLDSVIQITADVIEAWTLQFETGGEIQSSPALGNISVDDGLETLIGSNDYKLYAINSTGDQFWNYQTSGEIYGAPMLADVNSTYGGLEVIFGSCDNDVYALNSTGDLVWSYTTGGCIGSSPDVDDINSDSINDVVISSFDDNKIWAFSGNNGTELWNFTAGDSIWASPVIANLSLTDYRVYVGSYDGKMYCINGTNGSEIWNYSAIVSGKNNWIESSVSVGDIDDDSNLEVVFGSYNGRVYALDASDGTYEWNFTVPGTSPSIISSPVIVDVNNDTNMEIVIGSNTAYIFALNGTGSEIWNYSIPTGGRADSSPAIIDVNNDTYNDVVFGSSDNYIYAINGIDGIFIWKYNIGGSIWGSPAINDVTNNGNLEILVGSDSKNVTAIDPPSAVIPSTLSMWGGDSARTRLHDNTPPENQIITISDTNIDPLQSITMNSLWRDSYSDIAYATLEEDTSGSMVSHSYEISNPDWVNYVFSELRNDQTVNFVIRVYDSYGNMGTVSDSFTVGHTREIICGDGICDYGEAETCPQDCPRGEESEGGPTEELIEEIPTVSSVIEEVMKRIGEKLPEAAKNLVPLIVAIVLIGIIIYVFVI